MHWLYGEVLYDMHSLVTLPQLGIMQRRELINSPDAEQADRNLRILNHL